MIQTKNKFQNLLQTLTITFSYQHCGLVTDLNKLVALRAPGRHLNLSSWVFYSSKVTVAGDEPRKAFRISPRPVPTPYQPKIHGLFKRKASILANKLSMKKRMRRNRVCPRNRHFCSTSGIKYDSAKLFIDCMNSRLHCIKIENKRRTPRCEACDLVIESHGNFYAVRSELLILI